LSRICIIIIIYIFGNIQGNFPVLRANFFFLQKRKKKNKHTKKVVQKKGSLEKDHVEINLLK